MALQPIEERIGGSVALPRLYATLVSISLAQRFPLRTRRVRRHGVFGHAASAGNRRSAGARCGAQWNPADDFLQGGRLAAIGLLVGLTLSILLGQFLSKLLFGVTPFDVPTLVMVPTVLGVATVLASWLPARRAMRLDPVAVIRQD